MHNFYFDVLAGRKAGFLRPILLLLSGFYWAAVYVRGLFSRVVYRPKAYTISIGNIVAGGTGKTPFVIYLAKRILQKHSVGILIRSYKAKAEDAKTPFMFQRQAPSTLVGDEALLIAKNVPEVKLFCSKHKVASAEMADSCGIEYLLVDDGFQHRALGRDLDIVMLDAENPFGYNYLLPRGLLREPLSRLGRADLIVITSRNGRDMGPDDERTLRRYTKAPICKVRFIQQGIFDRQNSLCPIPKGTKVGLFCAIAKPEQFVETVAALGLDVVYKKFFIDHAAYSEHELMAMLQEAKSQGASLLITTEKDMVKIETTLAIFWLKVGIEVTTPSVLDDVLKRI